MNMAMAIGVRSAISTNITRMMVPASASPLIRQPPCLALRHSTWERPGVSCCVSMLRGTVESEQRLLEPDHRRQPEAGDHRRIGVPLWDTEQHGAGVRVERREPAE